MSKESKAHLMEKKIALQSLRFSPLKEKRVSLLCHRVVLHINNSDVMPVDRRLTLKNGWTTDLTRRMKNTCLNVNSPVKNKIQRYQPRLVFTYLEAVYIQAAAVSANGE